MNCLAASLMSAKELILISIVILLLFILLIFNKKGKLIIFILCPPPLASGHWSKAVCTTRYFFLELSVINGMSISSIDMPPCWNVSL